MLLIDGKRFPNINDLLASFPEGLMSIAADQDDHFFSVRLDIHADQKYTIGVARYEAGEQWSKNIIAYQSPDGTICECCKPNIAVKDHQICNVQKLAEWCQDYVSYVI